MNKPKQPKDLVKKSYDELSGNYDQISASGNYKAPAWLVKNFPEDLRSRPIKVLDLACASGNLGTLPQTINNQSKMIGVDLSPSMLSIAREKNMYADLFEFDLDSPLENLQLGKFDLILAFGFLEFIQNSRQFMESTYNHLLPNGFLLCSFQEGIEDDPQKPVLRKNKSGFFHFGSSKESVDKLLRNCSFENIMIEQSTGYTSPTDSKGCPYLFVRAQK